MTKPSLYQTDYDVEQCSVGVVHVGFGAFHRAHQAVYFDDYMQATGDLRWAIAAVNLRDGDADPFANAVENSLDYVLKSIAPDGAVSYRSVRSHKQVVDGAKDIESALNLLSDPQVQIVSMTVTESGYAFKDDWSLDLAAPDIVSELSGGPVQSIYGYLARALARRAKTIDAPITVMCCDNIRGNGRVLKNALYAYLEAAHEPELVDWLDRNVCFPRSMVDRITPRSTPTLTEEISSKFPNFSLPPVHAEAFSQWVLDDEFAGEKPALNKVGVQIVKDVTPFEEAKIRILNGGHIGLSYLGALAGYETFDQAMHDTVLRQHFDRFEMDEVLKGLGDTIPFDTKSYLDEIAARFENAGIADQLERICMDGYSKMAIYIRPTLRACLGQGISPKAGYDCVASWVVYARRHKRGTAVVPYHEPFWNKLEPLLEEGREHDLASDPLIWGDLPSQYEQFTPELVSAIQRMEEKWPD